MGLHYIMQHLFAYPFPLIFILRRTPDKCSKVRASVGFYYLPIKKYFTSLTVLLTSDRAHKNLNKRNLFLEDFKDFNSLIPLL